MNLEQLIDQLEASVAVEYGEENPYFKELGYKDNANYAVIFTVRGDNLFIHYTKHPVLGRPTLKDVLEEMAHLLQIHATETPNGYKSEYIAHGGSLALANDAWFEIERIVNWLKRYLTPDELFALMDIFYSND